MLLDSEMATCFADSEALVDDADSEALVLADSGAGLLTQEA